MFVNTSLRIVPFPYVLFAALLVIGAVFVLNVTEPVGSRVRASAFAGRTYTIVNQNGTPGADLMVPVTIDSQGDETGMEFSIGFNPAILSVSPGPGGPNPQITLGSGVPPGTVLTINVFQSLSGKIGVLIDSPTPFTAGTRELVKFGFHIPANAPLGPTPVTFTSDPLPQATGDTNGNLVQANFNNGVVNIGTLAAGIEGDINRAVANVPGTGDGHVDSADLIWFDRFANGANCPQVTPNEFQRMDVAPRAPNPGSPVVGLGDGSLPLGDRSQIERYIAGQDPLTSAGGPTSPTTPFCTALSRADIEPPVLETKSEAASRVLRLVPVLSADGAEVDLQMELTARGNEVVSQASVHFDPAVFRIADVSGVGVNPDISAGADVPEGTHIIVNTSNLADGNVGIVVDFNGTGSFPAKTLEPGVMRILNLRLHVLDNAPIGSSPVDFTDDTISQATFDAFGQSLATRYVGTIPGRASVSVRGQITLSNGRGLQNAEVYLQDASGNRQVAITSTFGYYHFDNVEAGQTYIIGVSSKRYHFDARALVVADNLTDVDFVSQTN
jgi:hypothetical protein